MSMLEFDGKVIEVDGDGFLVDSEIWDEKLAAFFAEKDGIATLTENHWAVIESIRRHWKETGMAPMIRTICKETGLKLREIYELFPLGPARGACKIAGLPKPDGCV